jgi:hypothetical protein
MAVADEAIEKLKAVIVSSELRPGQRLPGRLSRLTHDVGEDLRSDTFLRRRGLTASQSS